jgi:restriction system protein
MPSRPAHCRRFNPGRKIFLFLASCSEGCHLPGSTSSPSCSQSELWSPLFIKGADRNCWSVPKTPLPSLTCLGRISEVFKRQGFRVLHTGSDGPDGGVDLVLLKGTEKHLVQCKHWRASKVGVTTVRELYGVMTAQRATGGYVVTSGQFTEDAREFAAGRHLFLVDGPILKRWIRDIPKKTTRSEPRHPLQSATSTGPKSENCPQCGAEMVLRTAKQGANAGQRFWGCSTFPKCKGTKPLLGS